MGVFLVAYDLNTKGQDYPKVIRRIEQYNSQKVLESTWVVSTDKHAGELRDDLRAYIDSNDSLAVFQIGGSHPRWGLKNALPGVKAFLEANL